MDKYQRQKITETICREILPGARVTQDEKDKIAEIYVEMGQISFDALEKLSNFFATKQINIRHYSSQNGCDSCGYGAKHVVCVEVSNWGEMKVEDLGRKLRVCI